MRDELRKQLQKELTIEYADSYTENGCVIVGNLAIVECAKHWDTHPRNGVCGGMACFDWSEVGKDMILRAHPGAILKLSIPDVVMVLPA